MKRFILVDSQQFAYHSYNHIVESHHHTVFTASLYGLKYETVPHKATIIKRNPYRFEYIGEQHEGAIILSDTNENKFDIKINEMCNTIANNLCCLNWMSFGINMSNNKKQWVYRSKDDYRLYDHFTKEIINEGKDFIFDNLVHVYQPVKGFDLFYVLVNHQQIMLANIETETDTISIDYCDYHNAVMKDMIYYPRWKNCFENSNIIIRKGKEFGVDLFENCGYKLKNKDFDFSKLPVKIKTDLDYEQIGPGQYKFYADCNQGYIYVSIPTQLGASLDAGVNIQNTYLVHESAK